jgi:hypothetical protein
MTVETARNSENADPNCSWLDGFSTFPPPSHESIATQSSIFTTTERVAVEYWSRAEL